MPRPKPEFTVRLARNAGALALGAAVIASATASAQNDPRQELTQLGRELFFDKSLSLRGNHTISA